MICLVSSKITNAIQRKKNTTLRNNTKEIAVEVKQIFLDSKSSYSRTRLEYKRGDKFWNIRNQLRPLLTQIRSV